MFLTVPDPFYFGDDYDDCDTELVVLDNDGHPSDHSTPGGFVAGGFTQSKDMVWSDPANNFDPPPKPVPTEVPTGCYKDSTYTCKDGTKITDDTLKGVAYIFKGTASASGTAAETI